MGPCFATQLAIVYRIVMPSDRPSGQTRHQTENSNAEREKTAHLQHGYIKNGGQAQTTSDLLATIHLTTKYPSHARKLSSVDLTLFFFTMILSTALLLLYWCPVGLTAPSARNSTAEVGIERHKRLWTHCRTGTMLILAFGRPQIGGTLPTY